MTIQVTKDVKSLSQLISADAEGWSVVDIQLDEFLQVDVSHIFSCFSILAELDLVVHIFYLVKIGEQFAKSPETTILLLWSFCRIKLRSSTVQKMALHPHTSYLMLSREVGQSSH